MESADCTNFSSGLGTFHLTADGEVKSKVMASEFESVEKSLEKRLPPSELAEVRRILYGKELR